MRYLSRIKINLKSSARCWGMYTHSKSYTDAIVYHNDIMPEKQLELDISSIQHENVGTPNPKGSNSIWVE